MALEWHESEQTHFWMHGLIAYLSVWLDTSELVFIKTEEAVLLNDLYKTLIFKALAIKNNN